MLCSFARMAHTKNKQRDTMTRRHCTMALAIPWMIQGMLQCAHRLIPCTYYLNLQRCTRFVLIGGMLFDNYIQPSEIDKDCHVFPSLYLMLMLISFCTRSRTNSHVCLDYYLIIHPHVRLPPTSLALHIWQTIPSSAILTPPPLNMTPIYTLTCQRGSLCTARARRAHCALLLDYVPPKEPPSTPLGNALRNK